MRRSRAGSVAFGVGILVLFAAGYFAGILPLGLALRASLAALGLYVLLAVIRLLSIADGRGELETFSGWSEPARPARGWRRLVRRRRRASMRPSLDPGIERVLRISEGSEADFEVLLRPRLAAVCRRRLVDVGVDPYDTAAVARLLGPLGVRVLDPAPPASHDVRRPGVPVAEVQTLLNRAKELS